MCLSAFKSAPWQMHELIATDIFEVVQVATKEFTSKWLPRAGLLDNKCKNKRWIEQVSHAEDMTILIGGRSWDNHWLLYKVVRKGPAVERVAPGMRVGDERQPWWPGDCLSNLSGIEPLRLSHQSPAIIHFSICVVRWNVGPVNFWNESAPRFHFFSSLASFI